MIGIIGFLVLLAPFGVAGASAQVAADRALSLLYDELWVAGYRKILVIPRLLGGYVVEAQKDKVAVVIAVDGADFSVSYSELLTDPAGGFFATPRRPPNGDIAGILANYVQRLGSSSGPAEPLPPEVLVAPDTPNQRTTAFFAAQTISAIGDTAVIHRTETLGILIPVVTDTDTRVTVGGATSHRIEHWTNYSTQQASSVVTLNGMSGFSTQIFIDPAGFRNSLTVEVSVGSIPPVAGAIVNQIVSSIEGNLSQLPEVGRLVLPTDLRGQISGQLTPVP